MRVPSPGDQVHLAVQPGHVHLFDAGLGTRIAPPGEAVDPDGEAVS